MSTSEYPAPSLDRPLLPRLRAAVRARPIPADIWALGALVVLAAAIRIITIDTQSFWTDEALTSYEAHLPFGAMINTVAHVETTPPLYFVLVWVWAHIFGTSEAALRSISTLSGIALVPIAYMSARELFSRWAGVLAAAFVAVNPFLIWYSQEARAYMLLAALTGASFLWFIRAWKAPSRRNLTWWAVFSAFAVMTHFFAGFAVAPEALWLLWVSRSRACRLAVAAVGAAQLAMLPFAAIDTSHGAGWISAVPRTHRIITTVLEWGVSILERRGTTAEALGCGAVLIVVVAALIVIGGDRETKRGTIVAGSVAAFVFFAPLALALVGQDYFFSRNEIPAFVPLACVVAAACVVPRTRVLGAALAIALLATFSIAAVVVQTHSVFKRPDWRKVAHALGPATVPRAILAADGTTADPLKIYLPNVNWVQSHTRPVLLGEVDVVGATKRLAVLPGPSQLERLKAEAQLGDAPPTPIGSPVPRSISVPGAMLVSRFKVDNWIVARFALRTPKLYSINQLAALAPRYFRRTPQALLVFMQPAGS